MSPSLSLSPLSNLMGPVVLPVYAWLQGNPLECDWPTRDHTLKGKWLPFHKNLPTVNDTSVKGGDVWAFFSLASSCACFVESQSLAFHPCLEDIVSILSSPTPVSYHQSFLRLKSTFKIYVLRCLWFKTLRGCCFLFSWGSYYVTR